jgi:hypothetical protein
VGILSCTTYANHCTCYCNSNTLRTFHSRSIGTTTKSSRILLCVSDSWFQCYLCPTQILPVLSVEQTTWSIITLKFEIKRNNINSYTNRCYSNENIYYPLYDLLLFYHLYYNKSLLLIWSSYCQGVPSWHLLCHVLSLQLHRIGLSHVWWRFIDESQYYWNDRTQSGIDTPIK